jgi:hypothetical protein
MRAFNGWARVVAVFGCLVMLAAAAPANASSKAPKIKVLSNRADLISGNDALVKVKVPAGTERSDLHLTAGDRNVTRALKQIGPRKYEGRIKRLPEGKVPLVAQIKGGSGAELVVTNHPIGGPVFAGPQIQPWDCQDGALDAQCNQKPTFTFL